jgi:hypothetical protein
MRRPRRLSVNDGLGRSVRPPLGVAGQRRSEPDPCLGSPEFLDKNPIIQYAGPIATIGQNVAVTTTYVRMFAIGPPQFDILPTSNSETDPEFPPTSFNWNSDSCLLNRSVRSQISLRRLLSGGRLPPLGNQGLGDYLIVSTPKFVALTASGRRAPSQARQPLVIL